MKFVPFDQQNFVLAENQPQYTPLPVNINPATEGVPMTFAVEFTEDDFEEIRKNGNKAYFQQLTMGKNFQPVSLHTSLPENISKMNRSQLIDFMEKNEEAQADQAAKMDKTVQNG